MREGILFLARKRIDGIILEAVENLAPDFNITVICGPDEYETYKNIKSVTTLRDITIEDAVSFRNQNTKENILAEARKLENELDIGSYETNSNFMLYDIFVSRYADIPEIHKKFKEYLTEINILSFNLLKKAIAENNIKYVYFETVDLPISYILNAMAAKGILNTFEFRWIPLLDEHRIRLATGLSRQSPRIEHIYKKKLFSRQNLDLAREKLGGKTDAKACFYNNVHRMNFLSKIFVSIKRGVKWSSAGSFLIKRKNAFIAKKFFCPQIPIDPFVAIFLQHTPEASMCSQAPMHVNQHIFIEQLAIYALAGYKIAVKEHPRTLGNREKNFYADLVTLPNVCLLPPHIDAEEMIDKAKAVVVLTSASLAFSAILKNKFVFSFSDTFINFCKNVIRVRSPAEFWKKLAEIRDKKPDNNAPIEFLAACLEGTYLFPEGKKGTIFPERGGGRVLATALRDEIAFLAKIKRP